MHHRVNKCFQPKPMSSFCLWTGNGFRLYPSPSVTVETAWRPRGSWLHSELHLRSGPLFSLFCVIVTSSIPASPYQHLSTPSPLPYPITLKNKQITQNQRRHQLPVAGFEWQVQVALSPSCVVSKGRRDSKCPMRPGLYTDNT